MCTYLSVIVVLVTKYGKLLLCCRMISLVRFRVAGYNIVVPDKNYMHAVHGILNVHQQGNAQFLHLYSVYLK